MWVLFFLVLFLFLVFFCFGKFFKGCLRNWKKWVVLMVVENWVFGGIL